MGHGASSFCSTCTPGSSDTLVVRLTVTSSPCTVSDMGLLVAKAMASSWKVAAWATWLAAKARVSRAAFSGMFLGKCTCVFSG